MGVNKRMEAYGRYGWVILFAGAALGIFGSVALLFPSDPSLLPSDPRVPWLTRAWGITWVGFNILALAVIVGPYRRGERWAWYALWLLPLLLLSYFVLAPHISMNLVLAIFTAAFGLILPSRRYFSDTEQPPSGVRSTPEDPASPRHSD
jgi:cell division protein FtsW (lipid II flippase)